MPPGTAHIQSFVHLTIRLLVLSSFISFSIHSFILSFIHSSVHSSMQCIALINKYCWPFALLHLWQLPQTEAVAAYSAQSSNCNQELLAWYIQPSYIPLQSTHRAPTQHPPCTHPAATSHASRTHPAPTSHPSCTHPAPILHPLRTHPAPTSHPPCTHPASTPHPPQNSKFNPHLLAWCVQAEVDFAADAGVTPSPQSAFVTCASSLTEGGQTSSHADDTRALMTAVLLGGISQDDLTVW